MAEKQTPKVQKKIEPDIRNSLRTKAGKVLIVVSALIGLLALNYSSVLSWPQLCAWHALTGDNCPFCGLTRSLIALGDGDLVLSMQIHPFGIMTAGLLIGWIVLQTINIVSGRDKIKIPRRLKRTCGVLIGAIWLIWWIISVYGIHAEAFLSNLR